MFRRRELLDRDGELVDRGAQPFEAAAAGPKALEVALGTRRPGLGQRGERVSGEVVAQALGVVVSIAHGRTSDARSIPMPSARVTLIFSSPGRIRPFTVPSG